jgi:hypothetical protein
MALARICSFMYKLCFSLTSPSRRLRNRLMTSSTFAPPRVSRGVPNAWSGSTVTSATRYCGSQISCAYVGELNCGRLGKGTERGLGSLVCGRTRPAPRRRARHRGQDPGVEAAMALVSGAGHPSEHRQPRPDTDADLRARRSRNRPSAGTRAIRFPRRRGSRCR